MKTNFNLSSIVCAYCLASLLSTSTFAQIDLQCAGRDMHSVYLVVFVNGIGAYQVSAEWKYVATSQVTTPIDPNLPTADCGCESSKLVRNDIDPTLKVQSQILMSVVDASLSQLKYQRENVGAGTNKKEQREKNNL